MTDSEPFIKRLKQDEPEFMDEIRAINTDLLKEANDALQESNRLHVRPIVDESKLGIECFVGNKKDEFHGLIKTRYADFIVHEIDIDGNIAKLNVLEPPEEQEPPNSINLSDLIDGKALESLSEVNEGLLNQYKIDVTGMDKDTRTSLHVAIRGAFDRLESSTMSEAEVVNAQDNKKYIVVTRRNKVSRPKNVWPRDRPDHTHFILYKENKDTMDAIHNLAAAINARPSNFSSAGVKDRRAVTTQWLSSWRLEPKRLISAARRFNKRPFIKVGNFCFKKEPLRLGQLKANKFDIVIRHLVYNSEGIKVIDKAMESIKENGFVNYFGLQRFGTRSIQTHQIGLAVLQSKWDQAVDLILSYRFDDNMQPPEPQDKNHKNDLISENDSANQPTGDGQQTNNRLKSDGKRWASGAEQHNSFIDLWKSKLDAEIVFKKYPHYRFSNEGLIMKSLSKSEEASRDYCNALVSLPRNTRSLYVHSYQSLLWNKLTTYRLETHGFKVIPGDLILNPDSDISDNSLEILLSTDEGEIAHEESNGKNGDQKNSDSNVQANTRKMPIDDISKKIILATEENLDKYTIFDVVLPIIGSRVRIPENNVADELNRLLKSDNLTLDSFKAREKLFISYGSYRKIMVKPSNVNWRVKQYSNPHQNLVETDLDEIMSKEKDGSDKPSSPPKSDSTDEALIVEFELPPSSYATMCLREIMKKPSTDFNNKF